MNLIGVINFNILHIKYICSDTAEMILKGKIRMADNTEDDFGFTAISDTELKAGEIKVKTDVESKYRQQLSDIKKAIYPFINNLSKDPEKTTLLWPNRAEKMTEFKEKLDKLFGDIK